MFWGKTFDPDTDIKDLDGKVFLVTGGNTGLGREAVNKLAKHNPSHIYLAARTVSKGEAAVAEIKAAVPNARVSFLPLDLASFDSISSAAKTFTSQSKRLVRISGIEFPFLYCYSIRSTSLRLFLLEKRVLEFNVYHGNAEPEIINRMS